MPGLVIERLKVTHAGDDDNVYFLGDEHGVDRIQVDTWPDGMPPFLLEAESRRETSDIADAVATVCSWLGSGSGGQGGDPA